MKPQFLSLHTLQGHFLFRNRVLRKDNPIQNIRGLLPACVPHSRLPENWHMGNTRLSLFYSLPLLPELFSCQFFYLSVHSFTLYYPLKRTFAIRFRFLLMNAVCLRSCCCSFHSVSFPAYSIQKE